MSQDHTAFFTKQISLTEWLESIGHKDSAAMRIEDNEKRERLAVLGQIIGLPYDKPAQFTGPQVADRAHEFKIFLKEHGSDLCAIRLIPVKPDVPKLRIRGHSINEAVKWFDEQQIDPGDYRVDFVPHSEKTLWATTFIVNDHGFFGEITDGPHSDLTQGLYHGEGPITFSYDFKTWTLSRPDKSALEHLKSIADHLEVPKDAESQLRAKLDAQFTHGFLKGYFETSAPAEGGLWFIDYNRILGDLYGDFVEQADNSASDVLVSGRTGCAGTATGTVRIIEESDLADATLKSDEVLVCQMTTPDYVPLMKQAVAIVTDLGGILSHAAIVARELKKPCITGTKNATSVLKPGDTVTVDADRGAVTAP